MTLAHTISHYNIHMTSEVGTLPGFLRSIFWDVNFDSLSWEQHQDFIAQRVPQFGSWEAVCWLRGALGDAGLRYWLLRRKGARLDARRLHLWQIVLNLPPRSVERWLSSARNDPWTHRLVR